MRALPQALAGLALACAVAGAQAAQIVDQPTLGLAGKHSFTAIPGSPGASISWEVDRITRSESSGGSETTKRKVYTAKGESATFDLKKVSDKQTIWRIKATDSAGTDTQEVQVFPADKRSSFTYASTDNPTVRTYVVVPSTLSEDSKILFVMHGSSRNANDYCNYWRDWTKNRDIVLLCPRFDEGKWPDARSYNRGNVFSDDNDTKLNPESKWSFTMVESIHTYARKGFGVEDTYFDIWGHSAGGQFIERFLLFKPNSKVRLAMPANPGWYMMPSLSIAYQCGALHPKLTFTQDALFAFTQSDTVLFRGTADTDPNDPETGGCMDAQGKGRYARAGYFYTAIKTLNPQTSWTLIDVQNVDHDGEEMSYAAQEFLDSRN